MAANGIPVGDGLYEEITGALMGIHARYLGYAPASAATFRHDNVLVTLMHDVLSKAEGVLTRSGKHLEVGVSRELYRGEMEGDFRAAVERITGHRVVAFLGASQLEQDVAAEIFILDGLA